MKPFLTTLLSLLFVGGLYAQDEPVNDTVYMTFEGKENQNLEINITLSQWKRQLLYVDWGDKRFTVEYPQNFNDTVHRISHTYQKAGEYKIKLYLETGDFKARLLDLSFWYDNEGRTLDFISMDLHGCSALKEVNLFCVKNMTSLDVSGCTSLQRLYYLDRQLLTSLDVSGCTSLQELYCSGNQLTSLNVDGCTSLQKLDCYNCQLTSLDVSGCTSLQELTCSDSQLTSLDVSGCASLQKLVCYNCQLTSLGVRGCTALTGLNCSDNQLRSLDVSGCTALRSLDCFNNQITSLNMSGCTSFVSLSSGSNSGLAGNPLDSLDMSGCTALKGLSLSCGQLKWLDVSGCNNLVTLYCDDNQINALDLSACARLETVDCRNNQITSLNLRGLDSIAFVDTTRDRYWSPTRGVQIGGNPLDSLDVRDCASLTRVSWPNGRLKWLGVSGNAALETLNCDTNQLTSLDVSGCLQLRYLYCRDNRLTSLDLSGTSIKHIGEGRGMDYWSSGSSRISGNPLDSLDVSGCSALYSLICTDGQLKWLNVSGDTTLEYLYCDTNRLTSLDVSDCKKLYGLYCANNELTAINVEGCERLISGDFRNNHLPLSMLAPLSGVEDKSPQVIRGIELQALSPWDLSAEMLIKEKRTDVHCDADCYGFEADSTQLVFYKAGTYQVTLENENVYDVFGSAWTGFERIPVKVLYEVTVRPLDFVPEPEFSEYKELFQGYVSISCPIAEAEIYYTDDGSEPTTNSALYTKAIPMDRNMAIKAIAVFDDVVSQVATYEVKIVEAPVFSVPSGAVRKGTMVAISCAEEDAKIYYKIDAEAYGHLYTEPIRIDRSTTLRAWAVKGEDLSPTVEATYTIDDTPNETALSASTLRVYAQDRTIYLSEPAGEVEVFTTSGRRVYRGVSTAIPVPRPGVYVVSAAGRKYKVGVK